MDEINFSIAVFPFLKTSGPIQIGAHIFRSTTDLSGLSAEQTKCVSEIAQMLFLQNDLRVKSGTYTIISPIDFDTPTEELQRLKNIREVVAYLYAAPHEIFGEVFLTPDEASLAVFTPGQVSEFLVRPDYHTERVTPLTGPSPDIHHRIFGFAGLYNFSHHFWVEPGSRLYGPRPHMTLVHAQDLRFDLDEFRATRQDFGLLVRLLDKTPTPQIARILSAVHWFNESSERRNDSAKQLLNLAIAFETLLQLPESSKKDRLVDSIALLLGRIERLDDWAEQFYVARSEVVHQGILQDPYFYVPSNKERKLSDLFGSLMLFGRQVFRLCMGTLLHGYDLADRTELQEKFVSNNERYQFICDHLKGKVGTPNERLAGVSSTVRALKRYQFIASGTLSSGTLIAVVRYASENLLECNQPLNDDIIKALRTCTVDSKETDEIGQLSAVERLSQVLKKYSEKNLSPETIGVRDIVELVWSNLFMRYHWLKNPNG